MNYLINKFKELWDWAAKPAIKLNEKQNFRKILASTILLICCFALIGLNFSFTFLFFSSILYYLAMVAVSTVLMIIFLILMFWKDDPISKYFNRFCSTEMFMNEELYAYHFFQDIFGLSGVLTGLVLGNHWFPGILVSISFVSGSLFLIKFIKGNRRLR